MSETTDGLPDLSFDLDATLDAATAESNDKTRTRKERSDKGKSRPASRAGTRKLADELLNPWAKLAKAFAFGMPTVSAVMLSRGEATVDSLVSIASEHPRMLKALKDVSKIGPASELAETALYIVLAALLDFGKLSENHPIVGLTEVGALYEQVRPREQETDDSNNGYGLFQSGPPPAFPTTFEPFPR